LANLSIPLSTEPGLLLHNVKKYLQRQLSEKQNENKSHKNKSIDFIKMNLQNKYFGVYLHSQTGTKKG